MSQITSPRRGRLRSIVLIAVVLVPLAVAGLVVGAVSQVDEGLDRIPAAIVNNDKLITQTDADGKETSILAGRQLVTELTGKDSPGFDWTITNSEDAKQMLADGEVYAVLEVPKNFSKSITSLQSDDPVQAKIAISTDDAHNYLTGAVAQTLGDSLVATFGKQITEQYVSGVTTGIGTLGDALGESADGAGKLADGTSTLADGLSQLSDGAGTAETGANKYADGVKEYTGGISALAPGVGQYVDGVSKTSAGVGEYVGGVKQLVAGFKKIPAGVDAARDQIVPDVRDYTDGVSGLSAGIAAEVAKLQANPNDAEALATLKTLSDTLTEASSRGNQIPAGLTVGFNELGDGLAASLAKGAKPLVTKGSELASGADKVAAAGPAISAGLNKLDASGSALATGADGLASGFGELETGASKSASGATTLADGTTKLADGLQSGADQVPASDEDTAKKTADVATTPIALTVNRENEVTDLGQVIATLFVPLALWIGALAVFLVMRPVSRSILTSSAGNGRIALSAVTRASAITGVQALLVVALMHLSLGVSWALLPATLVFALVMAFAFTAFHYLLTMWLGRAGLVVSILLLAIQITSTGGLYPIQLLATPYQVISPFLPLTYAVSGMQAIITETGIGTVVFAAAGLLVLGVLSVLLSFGAIGRIRRARALGLTPAAA